MHKKTNTPLSTSSVNDKLAEAAKVTDNHLRFDAERTPPKLFLTNSFLTFPPAAEVKVNEEKNGSEVILRLMWGPLPAPFPRAVAATGVVVAVLFYFLSSSSLTNTLVSVALGGIPLLWFLFQQRGEHALQKTLSKHLQNGKWAVHHH